jgi:hypothetical protein
MNDFEWITHFLSATVSRRRAITEARRTTGQC